VPSALHCAQYSIAYLALGNRTAADAQLPLAFQHIDTAHYNTWIECFKPYCHLHFLTGAGGLLQNMVYGYGGLRLADGGAASRLEFSHPFPQLPPGGVTAMKLRAISFLAQPLDMWFNATTLCWSLAGGPAPGAPSLQVVWETDGRSQALTAELACAPVQPGYVSPQ
jgi:protein-glucosylgalactosylhydroxylysine glucosidase